LNRKEIAMKNFYSWNRRDFLARVTSALAASPLLGSSNFLFGQSTSIRPAAPQAEGSAKPIYRTLGKTGVSLPIVSMGVMNAEVPGLIPRSYELGVRHFDTAAHYQEGRNEEMVGRMIKQMGVRDKVIISTKVLPPGWSRDRGQVQTQTYSPAKIKTHFNEVFEGSLKRLQMDYVDILYNHAADSPAEIHSEGTLEAMTVLKKEGKVRFLAVSSHQPEMALKEAMKLLGVYDVVLIPINYTLAHDEGLLKTIDQAANKGIGLVAMKTQAGGAKRPDPKLDKPLTPASQTALLKWVLNHNTITTAIPGYTTYEQLEQNFSVASNLTYSAEEQEFLSDKNVAANAQFCVQCSKCRPDCPLGVDIPQLMRSHMYAVQYSNHSLAAETMAAIASGKGLAACGRCESCRATCRNSVNIATKIEHLKALSSAGVLKS
jgi:predicted aldo/keto reductase-like oxidoreductase